MEYVWILGLTYWRSVLQRCSQKYVQIWWLTSLLPSRRSGVQKKTSYIQDIWPVEYKVYITNTIIDPIIYFKECNSYFFVPLHDGWHFTTVNNQPLSARVLFVLPLWELTFATSRLGSQFTLSRCPSSAFLAALNAVSIALKTSTLSLSDYVVTLLKYQALRDHPQLILSTTQQKSWRLSQYSSEGVVSTPAVILLIMGSITRLILSQSGLVHQVLSIHPLVNT